METELSCWNRTSLYQTGLADAGKLTIAKGLAFETGMAQWQDLDTFLRATKKETQKKSKKHVLWQYIHDWTTNQSL